MSKKDELERILEAHKSWLDSMQKEGKRADLSGTNLDGINLSGMDLSGAVLRGTSLNNADLSNTQLIHVDFSDASMQSIKLTGANLLLTNFTGADLRNANLSQATVISDKEWGETRRSACFKDADLRGAQFQQCYCAFSDFSGANVVGANFHQAVLEHANISNNQLNDLDFSEAKLSYAKLIGSDLSGANLTHAELIHADLSGAILSRADVSGALMQSANLAEVKVDYIRYDRSGSFRGIRVSSCYGSSRFSRYAQDQDYIEEFKEAHPYTYYLWLWTTDCGRSLSRVALWSLMFALCFGLMYYSLGYEAFEISNHETLTWSLFTMIYYSLVTFTTLGFGDITPRTQMAASLVMMEVIIGYLMLGILISILANKVARRS